MTTPGKIGAPQAWELVDLPLHKLLAWGRKVDRASCSKSVRIAVAGDAATQHYCEALTAVLKLQGWWPELYEAEYDTVRLELLVEKSHLYRHDPQFVVLVPTTQSLVAKFAKASANTFVDEVLVETQELWGRIAKNCRATVIQHTLVVPIERPLGNQTLTTATTFAGAIHRINSGLLDLAAQNSVRIVDTESIAAYFGKQNWLDERLWCQARQAQSPKFIPPLAKSVGDTILADLGASVKCVIVDLDNTIWGGILADDGPELIEIGVAEVGLVFNRFQHTLLELKARGILLAVCSKNDVDLVAKVLDDHPDMVLRRSDFAVVVANFEDKVSNIQQIQKTLNIGFESMVFLDDTHFERDLIRTAMPMIVVPELPTDPAYFTSELARWNLFEGRIPTSEDLARLGYYQANQQREVERVAYGGITEYLAGLQMSAEVSTFNGFVLPRVLQLVQRSNQFNLTTIRHGEAELKQFALSPNAAPFCVRLKDRLGDNGIIAIVNLVRQGGEAIVETWIMSCRVLGRGVEQLTLQLMVERAKAFGCTRIVGRYTPTAKNGMVADLYLRLGFAAAGQDGEANLYVLDIADFTPLLHQIEVHEEPVRA